MKIKDYHIRYFLDAVLIILIFMGNAWALKICVVLCAIGMEMQGAISKNLTKEWLMMRNDIISLRKINVENMELFKNMSEEIHIIDKKQRSVS